MIPRLAKAIQGIVGSDISSDTTPATVASGVVALGIPDKERSEDHRAGADIGSDRQELPPRPRPPFASPTLLGNQFRFMNISSPTESRHPASHEAQNVPRSHLVNVMVPREDVQTVRDKTSANAAEANTFFFTAVEEYHNGGIVLPATPPISGSMGGSDSKDTSLGSVIAPKDGSSQLKHQVSTVVEERDKIVTQLFKQKVNFERTIADLKKQKDELSGENEALKVTLTELRSTLETSETSVQHLVSEHKRLDGLLSHTHSISARHQLESETLQRTVVTLKEESAIIINSRDATIEELKVKCDELDKRIVSLNTAHLEEKQRADKYKEEHEGLSAKLAETESFSKKLESERNELAKTLEKANEEHKSTKIEHEKGMEDLKAKHDVAIDGHKKRIEATEKKNADLEEEMQKLKASLIDRKAHAEEHRAENGNFSVESEAVETPDKLKAYPGLGKRRIIDSDNVEPQEKKSRHGFFDHGAESTRGRPGFRNKVRGLLGRSHSRAKTPEADERRQGRETELAHGITRGNLGNAPFTPPGSIAKSDSLSSTSTLNNADDEASVTGDGGAGNSPAGVSGTPKISVSKADDEDDYIFIDPATAGEDSGARAAVYASRWPPLVNIRSRSREPPPRLTLPAAEPLSPTPLSATHRRSRSPFSPLRSDRPPKTHAATEPYPSHRALSPPPSAPRRVTSPGHHGAYASSSKKRKQEAEPDSPPIIKSWYRRDDGVDSMGRQTKRNRTDA